MNLLLRLAREGSLIVATLITFISAPIALAADPAPTLNSSAGLKDAAKEGLPIAGPGLAVGVVGGILLAKAVGAAAAAGTAVTLGAVALPIVLIAVGVGLLAWGSWKIYKSLSAKNVNTSVPAPPANNPGRTDGTNPNAPGNTPGGPTGGTPTNGGPGRTNIPGGATGVDIRVPGVPGVSGLPISSGNNAARNDATTVFGAPSRGPAGPGVGTNR